MATQRYGEWGEWENESITGFYENSYEGKSANAKERALRKNVTYRRKNTNETRKMERDRGIMRTRKTCHEERDTETRMGLSGRDLWKWR